VVGVGVACRRVPGRRYVRRWEVDEKGLLKGNLSTNNGKVVRDGDVLGREGPDDDLMCRSSAISGFPLSHLGRDGGCARVRSH
jgi:hypothetical protein